MSDSSLNKFLGSATTAQRTAFTPSPPTPASLPDSGYTIWDTDLQALYAWNAGTAAWVLVGGGASSVTASGTLTASRIILGAGTTVVSALGSLGTTTTLLHGNAAGAPTFAAVSLTADVSGDLPYANLVQASAGSRVLLRNSGGAGDWQEGTIGSDLAISAGAVLSTSAGWLKTVATVTNANVITLPTTAQTLIAAPGAGFRLVFLLAILRTNFVSVYTGHQADGYLRLTLGGQTISNYVANDATTTPVLSGFTDLFNTNTVSTVYFVPNTQVTTPASQEWGNVANVYATSFDNGALQVVVSNGAPTNFGGGNAGNVFEFTIWYAVLTV